MHLVKLIDPSGAARVGIRFRDHISPLFGPARLADILESPQPAATAETLVDRQTSWDPSEVRLLAPIDQQEVWAAGVTYKRSRTARMEESEKGGGATFYDRVYTAPRPELFFKATAHRVAGPGEPVRIRRDSKWNVPEPELTLVINSRAELVGFTIGNDMSSRDIEGENPLYLPQAKLYQGSAALGPGITLVNAMPEPAQTKIHLTIRRGGNIAFAGETDLGQLNRTYEELIGWLARDNTFPNGVFLMTGTGIVPKDDFTLSPGDLVEIEIDGIGVLSNPVAQG